MSDYSRQIEFIDVLIKTGSHEAASRELVTLIGANPPRPYLAEIASHSRRVGLPQLGLKILRQYVRPLESDSHANDAEKSEYASCLIRLGLLREGLNLLHEVKSYPKADLISAWGFISLYEHQEAAKKLEKFLKGISETNYLHTVALVNLAQSLIALKENERGSEVLGKLRAETKRLNLGFLHANSLEFSAELELQKENFSAARNYILLAKKILKGSTVIDEFLVRKLEAKIHFAQGGWNSATKILLKEISNEAVRRKHWESIRDCDLIRANLSKDTEVFEKLYFGTPFNKYRENISAMFPTKSEFLLGQSQKVFDLESGSGLSGKLLDLARSLMSDLYKPKTISEIFADTFPDEYFLGKSSIDRVHQLLGRLRREFKKRKVRILETDGRYTLHSDKVSFRLVASYARVSRIEMLTLQRLSSTKTRDPLSAVQWSEILRTPLRSTQRSLQIAKKRGWVEQSSSGPHTRFKKIVS